MPRMVAPSKPLTSPSQPRALIGKPLLNRAPTSSCYSTWAKTTNYKTALLHFTDLDGVFVLIQGSWGGAWVRSEQNLAFFPFRVEEPFLVCVPGSKCEKTLKGGWGRWILLVKMTKDNVGQIPTWLWPHLNWLANSFHRHHFFSFSSWSIPAPL